MSEKIKYRYFKNSDSGDFELTRELETLEDLNPEEVRIEKQTESESQIIFSR